MTISTEAAIDLEGLPGAELVRRGVRDRAAGKHTVEALLVCVAAGRLRGLGLEVSDPLARNPELELYRALAEAGCDDPYARYNALLRELDSFLEAATARQRRHAAAG